MHRIVTTWAEIRQVWDGVLNFLMAGECVPFAFEMPAVEQVIDEVRRDPDARIWRGEKGEGLDMTDISEAFRRMPIEQAVESPFQMSHFKLPNFYAPGRLFHGFEGRVMGPWRRALAGAGFTWTRCYPIIFISGPGCATNYHMDRSHVIAWQRHGVKRFCGLRDPGRWAPPEERMKPGSTLRRPPGITEEDALVYEMGPGDVLWNTLLTPHWVEATDRVAYSLNLSHGGLRLNGRLCRHEQELEDWRQAHPEG
ncbi:MAG: hypothetical protein A3F84_20505 [Candidatus Handelsmanbacteria bacterium RIFCSPLOWO2_12_FULL_64_10]|uniref:JmjC domain-containing protein n=1 Tax=Handelsmanbacteria sp. (strain RIFCSPLOWO2_12_FULL_64_10) TaxID=1817868 RepID=A0A1F6C2Y9_HANXR|nr:MAG: hypothetical protein A3F84_20505 [Candidatus Handelsmanbacteria bacterium RIFCSPLOWO2_12_FULL_64_10]